MIDNHFRIGEVADTVGLSLRTIRYYEEIGLVTPSGRTEGGFRLYTDVDVERLRLVKTLKPLGMPLETVSQLLTCIDGLSDAETTDRQEAVRRLEEAVRVGLERCDQLERGLALARETLLHLSDLGTEEISTLGG